MASAVSGWRRRATAGVLAAVLAVPAAADAPPVGRWAPYSTGAARDLGRLTLTTVRARFARGVTFDLRASGDHYLVRTRAGARLAARALCGGAPPVAITIAEARSEVSPRTLRIGFYRGLPGPDPDFQPMLCVRYSYVPAR